MLLTEFAAELAVCLAKQNDHAEALALVDDTIAGEQQFNKILHVPMLLATKAKVILHGEVPDLHSAEKYLEMAIDLARGQSELSYELRAALELARIWTQNGEFQRARDLIRPIYDRFSEGFGTPDLVVAREMLGMP